MDGSVHPCKVAPHLTPVCRVPYGGEEHEHKGRYDILPVTNEMEWVPASRGQVPNGRQPVEGGYESGNKMYHAFATVQGIKTPGKTGGGLGGANIPFGGEEHVFTDGYSILCWR